MGPRLFLYSEFLEFLARQDSILENLAEERYHLEFFLRRVLNLEKNNFFQRLP